MMGSIRHKRYKMMSGQGFTVVELMVVVSLLAIALGVLTMSVTVAYGFDARDCAQDIDSLLSKTRIASMSRSGKIYLHLYRKVDDKCIYADYHEGTEKVSEKVGKAEVEIRYTIDGTGGGNLDDANKGKGIVLAFESSTGSFCNIGDAYKDTGSVVPEVKDKPDEGKYTSIEVTRGGKSYTIYLEPLTGYHYIN